MQITHSWTDVEFFGDVATSKYEPCQSTYMNKDTHVLLLFMFSAQEEHDEDDEDDGEMYEDLDERW